MKRKWTKCENTVNILDFPNEILTKIFKLAENDKNLSLTCMRFYKLISKINEKNVSLYVDYRYLISPFLDLDNFINSSSKVSLTIDKNSSLSNNFDEKLEFFLETFGHKVTKLIICSEIRNFRKIILPKLPNLEELEIHEEIFFDHSKVENFSLHLRKLKINCKIDLKLFEIFTFDELEINLYYFLSKDLKEFFENHENLGKMIIHNNDNINLKKVLKTMKLESLELFATFDQQNVVGNCLRTQTNLKELTLNDVCNEVFTIICDNLKDLEKINFAFTFDTSVEILSKFSNLQKLKSLTINSYLDEKQFQELIKSNLRNLNSLNFSIFFTFSTEDVENLAENFINLKSFTLTVFSKIHLKVIAKVFEKFDNLEELNLNFANNVQFTKSEVQKFFNQNHKNENLKSLTFDTKPFQIEFLIAKFILDFPNLERLNLGLFEDIKGFFEQILIGFKNLKRIENLKITEKMLETFLRYGQKLENFDIDLNMLEHPNEILKNSSMSLKMWHSLARISRENEMKIELTLMIYAHWKKIRTLMESSKKLKSLTIYSLLKHKYCDKVLFDTMKFLGEKVKTLTLQCFTSSQLETFLKAVPNCEKIILDCIFYLKENDEVLHVENKKIKSICVNVNLVYSRLENEVDRLNDLLRSIKLPKYSIKNFRFLIKNTDGVEDEKVLEKLENFLISQHGLNVKSKSFNEKSREYVFEFRNEKIE